MGAGGLVAEPDVGETYPLTLEQRLFLFTRADTVYGGSNEIQRKCSANECSAYRGSHDDRPHNINLDPEVCRGA